MTSTPKIIPTRFLILSDTHNFKFGVKDVAFKLPTPTIDVVLHSGDLTMAGGSWNYESCLQMLGSIPAELKLVIAGNHDKSLDAEWERTHKNGNLQAHHQAINIMTGPLAKEAGVTYLEEGLHSFELKNGAKFTIYASPYTPEFCDFGFPYERDEDRFNVEGHVAKGVKSIATNPVPDFPGCQIMMTHGPPKGIMDKNYSDTECGCDNLMRAAARAKPLLYCFGHIHEGYGASLVTWKDSSEPGPESIESMTETIQTYPEASQESDIKLGKNVLVNPYPNVMQRPEIRVGKDTLMVNSAIMTVRYQPENTPWVVDLDLPSK